MKKWKVLLAVLCVFALLTVAFAEDAVSSAPGSEGDPLITLGYLENVFRPQILQAAGETAEAKKSETETALNGLIDERLAALEQGGGTEPVGEGASFAVVTLSKGQTLTGDVGCEIMLRIGSANCVSPSNPGLIDTTSGGILNNGGALVTNHLYMVTISTRGITAVTNTVKVLVRGPYTVA